MPLSRKLGAANTSTPADNRVCRHPPSARPAHQSPRPFGCSNVTAPEVATVFHLQHEAIRVVGQYERLVLVALRLDARSADTGRRCP